MKLKLAMTMTILATAATFAAAPYAPSGDMRVLLQVPQQEMKVGGFWRAEYRKLAIKWLPH